MQEIQTLLLFSPTQQVVRGNHRGNCWFNLIDIMAKKARFLQKENNSDSYDHQRLQEDVEEELPPFSGQVKSLLLTQQYNVVIIFREGSLPS